MELGIDWWIHTLLGAVIASFISGAVLVGVLFAAPYAFLSDHPKDVQAAARAPTRRQRTAGFVGGTLFLMVLLASIGTVPIAWGAAHPSASLVELSLMTLVGVVVFSLLDLLVVDWLIICTWRPRGILIPGTEECVGWRDRSHHVREALQPKAIAVPIMLGLLLGGVAWLLTG